MKYRLLIAATVVSIMSTSMTATHAAGWKCSAAKLKNYSYSGGSSAMIHLRPYSSGGRYSVKKVSANKVTGKTKDGTRFTCTKK
jgi:hypothetical protein